MLSANVTERRLQLAGVTLILGLLVEGLSLLNRGPVAFVVFVGLGGLLFLVGVAGYLLALIRPGTSRL